MSAANCIVFILDDDPRICEALEDLLASRGLPSRSFNSISDYLVFPRPDLPACLILDVRLPDIDGLEFQSRASDDHPPIVFLTAHGDIPSSVRAIKRGAVNYLTKPFDEAELVDSVLAAVDLDRNGRRERGELSILKRRLLSLTDRERDVLPLVVGGLLNKQAAAQLGISEVTIQIHRSKIMRKMATASLADLVRAAERLNVPAASLRRRTDG